MFPLQICDFSDLEAIVSFKEGEEEEENLSKSGEVVHCDPYIDLYSGNLFNNDKIVK